MLHPPPGLCQRGEPAGLPPPPASEPGRGGPPRLEELAPRLGQQQVGSSASGLWPLPNCSLALGKVSCPSPGPTLPFFLPSAAAAAAAGLCVLLREGQRGAGARAKCLQRPGRVAFQPERVPRAPSLPCPPRPPPRVPQQNLRCGRRSRALNGERGRDARGYGRRRARERCHCRATGLLPPRCSPLTSKAPRLLRGANAAFPLALSSLNLVLRRRRRLPRSADLKSEQLDSNEFSGTATPTDTRALPSHQRLPALIPSNQARA